MRQEVQCARLLLCPTGLHHSPAASELLFTLLYSKLTAVIQPCCSFTTFSRRETKETLIKTTFQFASYTMLLGVSSVYGFLGLTTEMGVAVLAGAIGLAFSNLDKIARFKGAGFEAEMKMVQTMIENQTEPSTDQQEEAKRKDNLSGTDKKILKRLQKPGYTWRYAKTIAGEISKPELETEKALEALMLRGFTMSTKGSNGEIWSITPLGKSVQQQHDAQ